jgi:hypothetical protein
MTYYPGKERTVQVKAVRYEDQDALSRKQWDAMQKKWPEPKVIRLPYHGPGSNNRWKLVNGAIKHYGPKVHKQPEETMGWLKIWWVGAVEGDQPPSRRQYCSRRQIEGILEYWQRSCFCLLKHEFVPDTPGVLETILAESPLDKVLGI